MGKSFAISPFTMPAALAAADAILGGNPTWEGNPDNLEQVAWLDTFRRRAALASGMPEIRSHATESPVDHVAWLLSEGWDAKVTQGGPDDIFLASTINVVAKWRGVGQARNEDGIDRVLLKTGVYTSEAQAGEHRVIEVLTQTRGFNFCFQQVDHAPADKVALMSIALKMVARDSNEKVYLDFPMADLRVRDDARHMIGLRYGMNVVTQAAEQLRLELNEVGGRASAAAEVAIARSVSVDDTETIRIDGPFIIAINRNGAPMDGDKVMFAAYVDRDAWGKPAAGRI